MARIVRAGKLTLAALVATLSLFLDEATAVQEVPTLRMLGRSVREIAEQAVRIADQLVEREVLARVTVGKGYSQMGSGSLPTQNLPTRVVAIVPKHESVSTLARQLRSGRPGIFTRVKRRRLLVDPRTLLDGEEAALVDGLAEALTAKE